MNLDQFDMFAQHQPALPPALLLDDVAIIPAAPISTLARGAPDIAKLLPSPCIAWSRLMAQAPDVAVHVAVSLRWTGQVIETLCDPRVGLLHLHHDITILAKSHAEHGRPGRLVFRTLDQARALHRRHSLVEVCGGNAFAMFRFALPGEAATDLREMAQGTFT
jgi:hypothetical protein